MHRASARRAKASGQVTMRGSEGGFMTEPQKGLSQCQAKARQVLLITDSDF